MKPTLQSLILKAYDTLKGSDVTAEQMTALTKLIETAYNDEPVTDRFGREVGKGEDVR